MTDLYGPPRAWLAAILAAVVMTTACGRDGAGPSSTSGSRTAVTGQVTVLAAASLTDAFTQIGADFETVHPQVTVRFSFAGSQRLATQLLQGAPADVFASANTEQMQRVADAQLLAGDPAVFIGNTLAIAVAPGNPMGISGLADLADPDVTLVLAAEQVPAGRYAAQALARAGVEVAPSSLETDVRQVVAKVALGEADAGIVYRSDVAASDVGEVAIPAETNVTAAYPIAALAGAPNTDAAGAFVDYVQSEPARTTLDGFGFAPPP